MYTLKYNILANKWRPTNFHDMIEQEHIVTAIKKILVSKKIHHSYIFYGPKGTGKTTLARLFTKGLLCMKGITYNPCQICNNCKDIEKGICLDFLEIDGASHTKVEEIRDILLNISYLPNRSKYKIYLIDEFHMLSKHSFNALLKTLEEPPSHIKFILSTTEIQKIPSTILSRSIKFNFQLISNTSILIRLKNILINEKINSTLPALKLISLEAKGSLRDAITLTEHVILLSTSKYQFICLEAVNQVLCKINTKYIIYILENLIQQNINKLFNIIYFIDKNLSINWDNFINDLIVMTHKVLLLRILYNKTNEINIQNLILDEDIILSYLQKKKLLKISKYITLNVIKRIYNTLINYKKICITNVLNTRLIIEQIFIYILLY